MHEILFLELFQSTFLYVPPPPSLFQEAPLTLPALPVPKEGQAWMWQSRPHPWPRLQQHSWRVAFLARTFSHAWAAFGS